MAPTATEVPLSFDLACSWALTSLNVGATGMATAVSPDTTCTPGAVDPDVTQENYLVLVCAPGYADKVRPAAQYLEDLKLRQMKWYRLTQSPEEIEMSYVVPLELGGAPRDPRNLWPAPKTNAYKEIIPAILATIRRRACSAEITLAEAQIRIANATRGGLAAPVAALSVPVMGAKVPPDGHTWYTSPQRNTLHYYCDLDEGWRALKPDERRVFESEEALLTEWTARRTKAPDSRCTVASQGSVSQSPMRAPSTPSPTAPARTGSGPFPTGTAATTPPGMPSGNTVPAPAARPNLVSNTSFEGPASWRIVRAGAANLPPQLDATVARTGLYSARIEHVPSGNCPGVCGYWTSPISVLPGQQYEVSAWFRVSDSLLNQSGIYLTVRVPDGSGGFQPLFGFPAGARSVEWTLASRMLTVPASVAMIVIDISWWRNIDFPNAQGTIWLDDVSVR